MQQPLRAATFQVLIELSEETGWRPGMEAGRPERSVYAAIELRQMVGSEAGGEFILIQVCDDRRTALYPAHITQFGLITRQVHDFMCKRKCLCSQQDAEQQQSYRFPD